MKERNKLMSQILLSGLLVGTLDISAAIVQTLIKGGNPVKMFQFIASGVFGMKAFSQDFPFAPAGLLFHYVIAIGWTTLFFLVYPRVRLLSKSRVLTGVFYGIFVWSVMSLVVLPLSRTPPLPLTLSGGLIAASILIAAIGLPLSFLAHRYFSRTA